ncbi:recombinase, partial [Proteus mirabilis]|nr:recombinase [Proteus mirabilis]
SGQPIPVSSGGGGDSDSDLRWDGRRPDEEEDEYKRRCLMHAVQVIRNSQRKTIRR